MASGRAWWQAEKGVWIVKTDQVVNLEHITTINGSTQAVPVDMIIRDPRKINPKQRALFFALLNDIYNWSGEPQDFLKEWFYARYTVRTNGKTISLADTSQNSKTDATVLIDDVVDFIFEFDVPIKTGYELLPRDENQFQYQCIKHRKCLICGRHADINHVDEVGMRRDRTKVDHTQHRLCALCREHHTEWHQIGNTAFCHKYKITNLGIKVDQATLKRIGVEGAYETNLHEPRETAD